MTKAEKAILIEAERNLWFQLQFEYYVRLSDYSKDDFANCFEYQSHLYNSPDVRGKLSQWSAVNGLLELLKIEQAFDENTFEMQTAVWEYFRK